MTGFSGVIGSWENHEMAAPRIARIRPLERTGQGTSPLKRISPLRKRGHCGGAEAPSRRPVSDCPIRSRHTTQRIRFAATVKLAAYAWIRSERSERDMQVADIEKWWSGQFAVPQTGVQGVVQALAHEVIASNCQRRRYPGNVQTHHAERRSVRRADWRPPAHHVGIATGNASPFRSKDSGDHKRPVTMIGGRQSGSYSPRMMRPLLLPTACGMQHELAVSQAQEYRPVTRRATPGQETRSDCDDDALDGGGEDRPRAGSRK